jgi:hypothetical protein
MKIKDKFGITYVPNASIFNGVRIVWSESYGIPKLFNTKEQADLYAARIFKSQYDKLQIEIQDGLSCMALLKKEVELFSGRLKIVLIDGKKVYVVNDRSRKTYEELLPKLIKEYKSRREAKKAVRKIKKETEMEFE